MNFIQQKLELIKDLKGQYNSSLKSVRTLRNNCEFFLDQIEYEIALRTTEKAKFLTRTGLMLREYILGHYSQFAEEVHRRYCQQEQMYTCLLEQYLSLEQIIQHTEPMLRELQILKLMSSEKISQRHIITQTIYREEDSLKQNRQIRDFANSKDYQLGDRDVFTNNRVAGSQKRQQTRLNLLAIDKQNKEGFIEIGQQLQKIQVSELNAILDECLNSLDNLAFMETFKVCKQSSQKSQQSKNYSPSHGISLGLQSIHDDIDLMCNEEMGNLMKQSKQLEHITERQEYLESSLNPSPARQLIDQAN